MAAFPSRRGRILAAAAAALAALAPAGSGAFEVREGDFRIANFRFDSGETLPELRIHDRTIGHGGSSKPSDGLHAKFPKYGYRDAVEAQHRLLTEGLGVDHLRLLFGTSMGGMHAWLWGEIHPQFSDALMPTASLPVQIAGRNRMWRRLVIDAIRLDPGWEGGDRLVDEPTAAALASSDANDVLYQVQSSFDYDPEPGPGRISAPLLAINTGDDLINPPELGILERAIAKVPRGRAIVIPADERTVGHGTHTKAAVWKDHLSTLLRGTDGEDAGARR